MVTSLEQLRDAIGVLAASPTDQQSYLAEIGHFSNLRKVDKLTNIDELALQFEDATYLVVGLVQRRELTAEAARCVEKLDAAIAQVSGNGNSDFWTIGALYEDSRWTQIRVLAQDCLSEIA
jgi:hypothetical protein